MDNLSSSARAYKRRKIVLAGEEEQQAYLKTNGAGLVSSRTGFVGRILQGDSNNSPTPKASTNGASEGSEEIMEGQEDANGETDELEDGKGQNEVIIPRKGRRGRPQGRRKQDDSADLAMLEDTTAAEANAANGVREPRRSSRPRANSLTNGVPTPTKRGRPNKGHARTAQKSNKNSPDPLGKEVAALDGADSTHDTVAHATNGQTHGQDQSPEPMDVNEMEELPVRTRSSGRQRKKPRKYSVEVEIAVTSKKRGYGELVGILTPSKRHKGRIEKRKKYVAFEGSGGEAGEVDLGFRDIQSSGKKGLDDSPNRHHTNDAEEEDIVPAADGIDLLKDMDLTIPTLDLSLHKMSETNGHVQETDEIPEFAANFRRTCQDHALGDKLSFLSIIILQQLNSKRRIPLIGLDDEFSKVHQLVKQTVVAGEGNSVLVMGARGTGKTALVETVISDLAKDHQADFHVVRLNGFIHTDDRLALKEIWRQLGREMETDVEIGGNPISYADTLSSLLALLSHPEEISGEETDAAGKSVIFIMDEFDLFATHPRQTLLYNLFDVAQARKAPIAVIGLSTKVEVAESLEKRVKSRFSHRYVHLPMPKNLKTFEAICRAGLEVHCSDLPEFEGDGQILLAGWSQFLKGLFEQDGDFSTFLQRIFFQTKSVQDFFAACVLPILSLSIDALPTGKTFVVDGLSTPDSKLHVLEGLSALELSLLIAGARLNVILDQDACNFNMVFEEYQNMVSKARIQSFASGAAATGAGSKVWSRQLSLGAWERLGDYELIIPATRSFLPGGGVDTRDGSCDGRMFKLDVALEEIWPSVPGMSSIMSKWCKEI